MSIYKTKMVNGVQVALTSEEIAELEARDVEWNNGAKDRAMVNLRMKRNDLLKETDYYALSDVTMSSAMTTYRQALRDITNTYQSVDDEGFAWPTEPS